MTLGVMRPRKAEAPTPTLLICRTFICAFMSKISYLNSPPKRLAAGSVAWEQDFGEAGILRYRPAVAMLLWLLCVVCVWIGLWIGNQNVLAFLFAAWALAATLKSYITPLLSTPIPCGIVVIWAVSQNGWHRTRYVEEILEWDKVLDIVTSPAPADWDASYTWLVVVTTAEHFRDNKSHLQLAFPSETGSKRWAHVARGLRDAHSSDNAQKLAVSPQ
jgi:hypothetical protein